jgi:uncharacterized membrane protein YphA (DoxX/SURF4 family)
VFQRLLSAFPRGWPGVGLLLLRSAIGVTAVLQGALFVANSVNPPGAILMGALLMAASGFALVLGLLTPLAAGVVGITTIGMALSWLPPPTPNLFGATLSAVLVVVVAAAIICLGPGALSLDARMFGRREVIIPRMSRPPEV